MDFVLKRQARLETNGDIDIILHIVLIFWAQH